MPTPAVQPDLMTQAVEALRAGLGDRLVAVVLYGSRARGDAGPDSDWDLLVLAEDLPEKTFDRHLFINRLLSLGDRGGFAVLARTPGEFERRLPSLYLDIALDGKILYDPRGYAAGRLEALRRLLKESGLHREHTPDGDIWRWDKQPPGRWVLEWPA